MESKASTAPLRFTTKNLQRARNQNDGLVTNSSIEQEEVESTVDACFQRCNAKLEIDVGVPELKRDTHRKFLLKGLKNLSESYQCLDASKPWLCFWILHSLELLEEPIDKSLKSAVAKFIGKCQHPDGGFGGGPGQDPHLAPTYAAVNALCILGTQESYDIINREKLRDFIMSVRTPTGSFIMHKGGEEDIRGAYCAASAASLTNIITPEMFHLTPEWIVKCQTYEGGFGGVPDMEAHGGYSFCGLAALVMLGKESLCDIKQLLRWTSRRQMAFEGGFQGRSNKLVDGCYSYWQGAAFPLLHIIQATKGDKNLSSERWLFNQEALQEYILACCQDQFGGLIDKPGKSRDYYHTCYCLSGLSVAQHVTTGKTMYIVGHPENELAPIHPVFNIGVLAAKEAMEYFKSKQSLAEGGCRVEEVDKSTCSV